MTFVGNEIAFLAMVFSATVFLIVAALKLPSWFRLYRFDVGTIGRILIPPAIAILLALVSAKIPPILGNLAVLLFRRKKENLAELDMVVSSGDVGRLGKAWFSLYQEIVRTKKIPPLALRLGASFPVTLLVVVSLAMQRDQAFLNALSTSIKAAEEQDRIIREQSRDILAFQSLVAIISTLAWILVHGGFSEPLPDYVRLIQIATTFFVALGVEVIFRAIP